MVNHRALGSWTLAALSGLLLITACGDTPTLPSELEPQFAKGGGGPKKKPPQQDDRLLWKVPTGGWIFGGAALDGETLYFSSFSDHFYAVGLDGRVRWTLRADISGGSQRPPVVEGGVVYFTSLRQVFAVDAASGDVRWSRTLGSVQQKGKRLTGPIMGGLSVNGKWIHVGNSEGYLFTLNKEDGVTVHSVLVDSEQRQRVFAEPTFAKGRLYVGARKPSFGGVVHSFDVDPETGFLKPHSLNDEVGSIRTSLVHDG